MSGKRVVIGAHARFQMRRRGITPAEVVAAVQRPDQVITSTKGRKIRQSLIGPRSRLLLRVVVTETASAYFVVTVYKTSRLAKYWIRS